MASIHVHSSPMVGLTLAAVALVVALGLLPHAAHEGQAFAAGTTALTRPAIMTASRAGTVTLSRAPTQRTAQAPAPLLEEGTVNMTAKPHHPGLGSIAAIACLTVVATCVALAHRLQRTGADLLQPLTLTSSAPAASWTMTAAAAAKPLEGKVALVTGATRGIGACIAKALGEAGATVIGTATSESGAESITQALQAQGIPGQGILLNVTSEAMVKAAAQTITDKYGAPTIIVNNAGITRDKLLLQMKEDDWSAVIDTNLTSIFRVTKAFQRGLSKARWGRIISISSVVGSIGNMGQCNYASAKAGLEGFTKCLAREMATRNVTVNAVAPGFIETDMTKDLPAEWADKLKAAIPLARMGTPEEVASAVVFLASPSSGYITGQTLHVNGGMYMN